MRCPLLLALLLSACAAEPTSIDEAASVTARSHVGAAVIDALDGAYPDERGRTWSVSTDNRLDAGWIVQTPPASHWGAPELAQAATCTGGAGCDVDLGLRTCATSADCGAGGRCVALAATRRAPGDVAGLRCAGHSDALLDELHELVTRGEQLVDVTSLQPPDGRFEAALRNALTYLGATGRRVTVRLLFGAFPVQGEVDARAVLASLTRDLPASARVTVQVGNYRSSNLPPSWNHSKIVAVDGAVALVGGHNLWTEHYLGVEPVHDLSMRVAGTAAHDAQAFAELQWRWTCANRSWLTRLTGSVAAFRWRAGRIDDRCATDAPRPDARPGGGDVAVIGAGRLAWVDPDDDANPADLALVAMIEAARSSVRISQQDLGPVQVPVLGIPIGGWDDGVMDALGAALARGVRVEVVVSSPEASVGGLGPSQAPYANGWTLEEVAAELRARVIAQGGPRGAALDALLCERLAVAPLRFSAEDRFAGGGAPGNHAKLVLVDDVAFHVGSQNLYPAGLTEYGYIVDDPRAAATLAATYWDPMWAESSRRAVSGAACE